MSFFDRPVPISRKNAYFAAANTYLGFRSYFPTLFTPYRKLIIKGGPGSGKSTLMKKLAIAAEEKGYAVERYYCSSDTSSLDGVAIPALALAVLDGTPPHAIEPSLPGARDSLLDLTAFWREERLKSSCDEIQGLQERISHLYRQVYCLMNAVYQIEKAADATLASAFCQENAHRIICRMLDKYKICGENEGSAILRPTSAFGVKGYVALDTHEKAARITVTVKDRALFAHRFFDLLQKELLRRGATFEITPRPLDERIDSLYLPREGIFITARRQDADTEGCINLDRMLPARGAGILKDCRGILKEADALIGQITAILERIGALHDTLESHYIAAMDFPALNRFSEELIKKEIVGT